MPSIIKETKNKNRNDDIAFIDLKQLLGAVLEKKWFIIFVALVFVVFAVIICYLRLPVYNTNALININASKGSGVFQVL